MRGDMAGMTWLRICLIHIGGIIKLVLGILSASEDSMRDKLT
jgi:hypothetical protein